MNLTLIYTQALEETFKKVPRSINADLEPLLFASDRITDLIKSGMLDEMIDIKPLFDRILLNYKHLSEYPNWWLTQWAFTSIISVFRAAPKLTFQHFSAKSLSPFAQEILDFIYQYVIKPVLKVEIRDAAGQCLGVLCNIMGSDYTRNICFPRIKQGFEAAKAAKATKYEPIQGYLLALSYIISFSKETNQETLDYILEHFCHWIQCDSYLHNSYFLRHANYRVLNKMVFSPTFQPFIKTSKLFVSHLFLGIQDEEIIVRRMAGSALATIILLNENHLDLLENLSKLLNPQAPWMIFHGVAWTCFQYCRHCKISTPNPNLVKTLHSLLNAGLNNTDTDKNLTLSVKGSVKTCAIRGLIYYTILTNPNPSWYSDNVEPYLKALVQSHYTVLVDGAILALSDLLNEKPSFVYFPGVAECHLDIFTATYHAALSTRVAANVLFKGIILLYGMDKNSLPNGHQSLLVQLDRNAPESKDSIYMNFIKTNQNLILQGIQKRLKTSNIAEDQENSFRALQKFFTITEKNSQDALVIQPLFLQISNLLESLKSLNANEQASKNDVCAAGFLALSAIIRRHSETPDDIKHLVESIYDKILVLLSSSNQSDRTVNSILHLLESLLLVDFPQEKKSQIIAILVPYALSFNQQTFYSVCCIFSQFNLHISVLEKKSWPALDSTIVEQFIQSNNVQASSRYLNLVMTCGLLESKSNSLPADFILCRKLLVLACRGLEKQYLDNPLIHAPCMASISKIFEFFSKKKLDGLSLISPEECILLQKWSTTAMIVCFHAGFVASTVKNVFGGQVPADLQKGISTPLDTLLPHPQFGFKQQLAEYRTSCLIVVGRILGLFTVFLTNPTTQKLAVKPAQMYFPKFLMACGSYSMQEISNSVKPSIDVVCRVLSKGMKVFPPLYNGIFLRFVDQIGMKMKIPKEQFVGGISAKETLDMKSISSIPSFPLKNSFSTLIWCFSNPPMIDSFETNMQLDDSHIWSICKWDDQPFSHLVNPFSKVYVAADNADIPQLFSEAIKTDSIYSLVPFFSSVSGEICNEIVKLSVNFLLKALPTIQPPKVKRVEGIGGHEFDVKFQTTISLSSTQFCSIVSIIGSLLNENNYQLATPLIEFFSNSDFHSLFQTQACSCLLQILLPWFQIVAPFGWDYIADPTHLLSVKRGMFLSLLKSTTHRQVDAYAKSYL